MKLLILAIIVAWLLMGASIWVIDRLIAAIYQEMNNRTESDPSSQAHDARFSS